MPTEFLQVRIGARFVFVTALPNLAFGVLVTFLLAAGAPARRPTWQTFESAIDHVSVGAALLLSVAVVATSVAAHPLTYPLVQLVEGYWGGLPNGPRLQKAAAAAISRHRKHLYDLRLTGRAGGVSREDLDDAERRLTWLPDAAYPVLPSTLGNVLFAGEVRAGARYGYDTAVVWPRLYPLLGDDVRGQVTDTRNQMDAAARLCVLSLLAVPVTLVLLMPYDVWLLVPLGCYVFAWISYRSAVAAAKRFCDALAVAFDLHHLVLWDALGLKRPADLDEEFVERGPMLSMALRGRPLLTPPRRKTLVYPPAVSRPSS